MKVKIVIDNTINSPEVVVTCKEVDDEISTLSKYIENFGENIIGYIDNDKYVIPVRDIYYFEAVDNKVFAYTEKQVYQVNYKLAFLAEKYVDNSFLQTSRTIVLNINTIDHVLTLINGRILAVLNNSEKQIITRAYAQDFKDMINMKGRVS